MPPLNNLKSVAKYLEAPFWTITEFLNEAAHSPKQPVDEILVTKLLRQSGLSSENKQGIMQDLEEQLKLVNMISSADVDEYEPLIRLGSKPMELSMEQMISPIKPNKDQWPNDNAVSLAAGAQQDFYTLKENLRGLEGN